MKPTTLLLTTLFTLTNAFNAMIYRDLECQHELAQIHVRDNSCVYDLPEYRSWKITHPGSYLQHAYTFDSRESCHSRASGCEGAHRLHYEGPQHFNASHTPKCYVSRARSEEQWAKSRSMSSSAMTCAAYAFFVGY